MAGGRCQMANEVAAPRGMHRGKPHCGERTTWERAVRRILFASFEALCVFGYLELVYHLLNLTIHKDRKVVG